MQAFHVATSIQSSGAYLSARGQKPGELLRDLKLAPEVLLNSSLWLDRDVVLGFASNLERYTGDPLAGMGVAQILQIGDYGDWAQRLAAAPTLGTALRYVCLHIHLLETGTRLSLRRRLDRVWLTTQLVGPLGRDPRQQLEGHLVVLLKVLRAASAPFEVRMYLPYRHPDRQAAEELLGVAVVDRSHCAGFEFDVAALELDLVSASMTSGSPKSPDENVCREVCSHVEHMLGSGRPTLLRVAEEMAMHARSLQRRLAGWGISFEEVLDSCCKRRARDLLSDDLLSVTEIAHALGYSDAAHFTRACRRWYGVSPRQLRDWSCTPG